MTHEICIFKQNKQYLLFGLRKQGYLAKIYGSEHGSAQHNIIMFFCLFMHADWQQTGR